MGNLADAMTSRYTTPSLLAFTTGLLVQLGKSGPRAKSFITNRWFLLSILAVVLFSVIAQPANYLIARQYGDSYAQGEAAILSGANDEDAWRVAFRGLPPFVRPSSVEYLSKRHLSVFRNGSQNWIGQKLDEHFSQAAQTIQGSIDCALPVGKPNDREFVFRGWATDIHEEENRGVVLVDSKGIIKGATARHTSRDDVKATLGGYIHSNTGWHFYGRGLPSGTYSIYVTDLKSMTYCKLTDFPLP